MKLLRQSTSGFAGGMSDRASVADDFRRDECTLMMNVRPGRDGSAEWLPADQSYFAGTDTYDPAEEPQLFEYDAGGGRLIRAVGATVQASADRGVSWTTLAGGLTPGWWDTAMWRQGATDYLLMVNGAHAKYYDGAVLADIPNVPTGARFITTGNSRVWVAGMPGATERVTVRASKIADFSEWGAAEGLSLQVGTHIRAIHMLGSRVIVFGRRSVAYIEGFGQSEVIVATGSRGISDSVGCRSFRTVVAAGGGGLCFQSDRGMEYCDGDEVRPIGQNLATLLGMIDRTEVQRLRFHGMYHEERGEYWLRLVLTQVLPPGAAVLQNPTYQGYVVQPHAVTAVASVADGACWVRNRTSDSFGLTSFVRFATPNLGIAGSFGLSTLACRDGAMWVLDMRQDVARGDGLLVSPLWDFGRAAAPKRARLVRVAAAQAGLIPGDTLQVRTMGEKGTTLNTNAASVEVQPAPGSSPALLRVSERGTSLRVEVGTQDVAGLRVTGIEMEAEVMEGVR